MKNQKIKSIKFNKISILCILICLLIAFVSCSNNSNISGNTTEKNEFELQFSLKAGEKGEYGKLLTYNAETEFEETFYAYYVPSGKYLVTNIGDFFAQVGSYTNETKVTDDGWEEPVNCIVITLKAGESKELNVPTGYHIDISGKTHITMKKIN